MASFGSALPASTAVPLRGGPVMRWGVLAPGQIARDFIDTLHRNSDQRAVAVASRTLARAEAFAAQHGIDRAYGNYEQLVADPGVDIVYIAAPHSEHRALALLAIAAGKHVLIEKPIALNAAEAREIADAAGAASVFVMEAMWSRFLPQSTVLHQLLADGALAEIGLVRASYGSRMSFDPLSRAFDPALGGGALLDIGVYAVWFAQFVLGAPGRVTATGTLAPSGVDEQTVVTLDGPGSSQAQLFTSLRTAVPPTAQIFGTEARIDIAPSYLMPGGFALSNAAGEQRVWNDESGLRGREGLVWQATAVAADIADGRLDSALHPLSSAIAQLETIDAARAQLGAL